MDIKQNKLFLVTAVLLEEMWLNFDNTFISKALNLNNGNNPIVHVWVNILEITLT